MSMHEIEDLVEETVRLVLDEDRPDEEKRRLIFNLYRVQGWFDTSDTTGRLSGALQALGYFDHLPQAPIPALPLVAEAMRMAAARGDRGLGQRWLALLQMALDDLDLGDEVPARFDGILASADAAAIRQAAQALGRSGGVRGLRLRRWSKPAWPEADEAEVDRRHRLRYFTDLDTDEAVIRADHAAALRRLAEAETGPLSRIPDIVGEMAGHALAGSGRKRETRHFVFALGPPPPDQDGASFFLVLSHDARVGLLIADLGVQHGLLCRWQGRPAGVRPEDMHFRISLVRLFPQSVFESDAEVDPWGGWRYKATQSEKVLRKRLASLFRHWSHTDPVFAFHRRPLADHLASADIDTLEAGRRALRDTVGYFLNDIELMFAKACLLRDTGQDPAPLAERISARLAVVHPDYHLRKHWADGVARLADGPWFPPLDHGFPYKPQLPA